MCFGMRKSNESAMDHRRHVRERPMTKLQNGPSKKSATIARNQSRLDRFFLLVVVLVAQQHLALIVPCTLACI